MYVSRSYSCAGGEESMRQSLRIPTSRVERSIIDCVDLDKCIFFQGLWNLSFFGASWFLVSREPSGVRVMADAANGFRFPPVLSDDDKVNRGINMLVAAEFPDCGD